jgi:hypothetical protein
MLDHGNFNESDNDAKFDEFAENSLDSVSEPTASDLLDTTVSIHTIVDQVNAEYAAFNFGTIEVMDTPVADLHPQGHLFNKVNGVLFCACQCEYCNGDIPAGKHYPSCICVECECDEH